MKKIAVIIARAGSKRIPNKNMKKFLGQPIIKRVIKILKKTNMFNDIYISTDSLKIGNYVKKLGVKLILP